MWTCDFTMIWFTCCDIDLMWTFCSILFHCLDILFWIENNIALLSPWIIDLKKPMYFCVTHGRRSCFSLMYWGNAVRETNKKLENWCNSQLGYLAWFLEKVTTLVKFLSISPIYMSKKHGQLCKNKNITTYWLSMLSCLCCTFPPCSIRGKHDQTKLRI